VCYCLFPDRRWTAVWTASVSVCILQSCRCYSVPWTALFKLHVDKVCLFEADDFTQALISFFAAFWIFNVQYNPKVFNFLTFLERINWNCYPSTGYQNYKITPVSCKDTSAWVKSSAWNSSSGPKKLLIVNLTCLWLLHSFGVTVDMTKLRFLCVSFFVWNICVKYL